MEHLVTELKEANVGEVLVSEPLSKHTTMKIGGPADILFIPKSIGHLQNALSIIKKHDVNITCIGRGSNLLVSDNGIRGVVVKLGEGLDHLEINEDVITVGAGYPLVKLATVMSRNGFSGLEFAGGIPASVGGAVYMNAGAHKSDMAAILLSAKVLLTNGELIDLSNEEMKYSYRTSVLQNELPGFCVEATFQLRKGNKEEITSEMKKYKEYRKQTQPWNLPCAGSIFRNPLPNYAGKLIEEANLKGYEIGGAQISPLHGNFIVNKNKATAKDVHNLIQYIQKTIYEQYGIQLQTELEIIE